MATIRYKCDTCLREVELVENKTGLTTLSNCVITENCRGSLFRIRRSRGSRIQDNTEFDNNLVNRRERKIFFPFTKDIPSKRWVVEHNLGNFPAVSVFVETDGGFNIREADSSEYVRKDIDKNTLEILFDGNETGKVHAVSRSISEQDVPQSTFLENSINISPNGTLSVAVLSKAFGEASTDPLNPMDVKFDVSIKEPNEEEIFCVEDFNGANISPWSDYLGMSFRKRRNYIIKTVNLLDLKVIQQKYDSLDDIPELTEFKFKNISYNGSPFSPIRSKNALLLLSSPPYTKSDKVLDGVIDLGERNVEEDGRKYVFSGGKLLAVEEDVERVYPPIEKDDVLIRSDNVFGPNPTPIPSSEPTPTPTISITPSNTPAPSISATPTMTPSPSPLTGPKSVIYLANSDSTLTDGALQQLEFFDGQLQTVGGFEENTEFATAGAASLQGVEIDPSGTKLYVLDTQNDFIQVFRLDTPFDLDTSYPTSEILDMFAIPGVFDVVDMKFSHDGTKVFTQNVDRPNDRLEILSFTLSSPWVLNGATHDNNNLLITDNPDQIPFTRPTGLEFSSDGTKMYILGVDSSLDFTIERHDLSTPWDISTASVTANKLVVTGDLVEPRDIFLSPDGTKILVTDSPSFSVGEVKQYNLSVAFDLTTAALSSTVIDISAKSESPEALSISADGQRLLVGGNSYFAVSQYILSAPFDIEGGVTPATGTATTMSLFPARDSLTAWVDQSRTRLYTLDFVDVSGGVRTYITHWEFVIPGNISTLRLVSKDLYDERLTSQSSNLVGEDNAKIFINSVGEKLYILNSQGLHSWTFSTPWAIDTLTEDGVIINVSSTNPIYGGISSSVDGTKIFVSDTNINTIFMFDLSIAWDLSTAAENPITFVPGLSPDVFDFSEDGQILYVLDTSTTDIKAYSLISPWDIDSPTLLSETNLSTVTSGNVKSNGLTRSICVLGNTIPAPTPTPTVTPTPSTSI